MFAASLIRLEPVGKTAESGNWHGLFYRGNNPSVNGCSESAITAAVRRFWNPMRTADTTTLQIFLPNVVVSDFLSLVRERIEMRVINPAKAACKDDSTPPPPPLLDRGGEVPKSTISSLASIHPLAFVMRPSLPLEAQPARLPYKFFFVQASMRSSAFSMFSIEFATLKRR